MKAVTIQTSIERSDLEAQRKQTEVKVHRKPFRVTICNGGLYVLLAIFIISILSLSHNAYRHGVHQTISQVFSKIIPTSKEWDLHLKCNSGGHVGCESTCDRTMIAYMHPPKNNTIALLSMRGTGGSYLRHLSQIGTRIWTGIEECFYPYKYSGYFDAECFGSYHFKHYLFTRFLNPVSINNEDGFNPDKVILLTRNPFDAIISAYNFYSQCDDAVSPKFFCVGRISEELTSKAPMNSSVFNKFAEAYAMNWASGFQYAQSFKENSIVIYFEDLVGGDDQEKNDTLLGLFTFIKKDNDVNYVPPPVVSVECAMDDKDTYAIRTTVLDLNKTKIFTNELIKKICFYVDKYWVVEKFGANPC